MTAADDKFCDIFPNLKKNKVWFFMRLLCQQMILMKYHALFVIFSSPEQKTQGELIGWESSGRPSVHTFKHEYL